jgi:hypothetical protein
VEKFPYEKSLAAPRATESISVKRRCHEAKKPRQTDWNENHESNRLMRLAQGRIDQKHDGSERCKAP